MSHARLSPGGHKKRRLFSPQQKAEIVKYSGIAGVDKAAKFFKVHPSGIYNWRKTNGQLPLAAGAGGTHRFPREVILLARRVQTFARTADLTQDLPLYALLLCKEILK